MPHRIMVDSLYLRAPADVNGWIGAVAGPGSTFVQRTEKDLEGTLAAFYVAVQQTSQRGAAMATQSYEFPKFDMSMMPMKPVDPEAVMAAHRRNLDAMTRAGQILADGARSFTQRQSEIVQARMNEFGSKAESYMKTQKAGDVDVQGGVEDAKSAYEQAVADARELMEIVAKAQADALQVVNQCMLANLEAMKKFTG